MARREREDWPWTIDDDLRALRDELSKAGRTVVRRRVWEPRVDLFEQEDGFTLKAEIAGVRGEDIQLSYTPDARTLTIKGVRHEETVGRRGVRCYQLEVYYGEFEREVELPDCPIDVDGIRAQYRNGFLIVFVPKIGVACTERMDLQDA